MKSAEPFSASSRNLLSLGSRHAVMVSTISIFMHSGAIRVKNRLRSSGLKYLSNFGRART